jgi:hypothetical protein
MRKPVEWTLIVTLSLALYIVAWIAASIGLLRDVEIGYFGEFNVAKHAIQESGCAELIEYSGVNKDVVLEEFHFKVTTKSGRVVRLWFDASNMDVSQVCYYPVGFSIMHPVYEKGRRFTPIMLSDLLKEKGIKLRDLKDILCNIEELEQACRTAPRDNIALRETDPYVWDYLRIEFPTEEELDGWIYTDVREKDVVDWP